MVKVYEFIGDSNNSENIQYGTPFALIGFCEGEYYLHKVTWYDVKYNPEVIHNYFDNTTVSIIIDFGFFKKYFRFSQEI